MKGEGKVMTVIRNTTAAAIMNHGLQPLRVKYTVNCKEI